MNKQPSYLPKILCLTAMGIPALLSGSASAAALANLRCEYRDNPLGIDVTKPRLSWVMESERRGERQTAYQVLVASSEELLKKDKGDLCDTGKVASDRSIQVAYEGRPLELRMSCHWKVPVWDKDGKPSEWSKPALWTMGLLKPEDWTAKWIKPGVAAQGTSGLTGCSWIWSPHAGNFRQTPPGPAYFRAHLNLPPDIKVKRASVVMSADNAFVLSI